jgi:hypothetical protein
VAEVWILDPVARTVEVRIAAGRRVFAEAETARSGALPGFDLRAGELLS